ncbi:GTP 3',8-cyclase MoaA [Dermabacteraceae bacterium TAE3-ERU27]|nr:GTP 3',8-cyclase MoaA [Dermabacteraceae bacterium TAE3-ERU27]
MSSGRTVLGMPRIPRSVDPETGLPDTTGRPDDPGLVDRFGRHAIDLRISLTDFCNLRCTYCMPAEGLDFLRGDKLMSVEEITRLVRIAVHDFGVEQVRFTGGEPLTRKDLPEILRSVSQISPKPDISVTTNAIGLEVRAAELKEAGLDRINVSLDSVVSETFETITRRPLLHRVIEGVDGAAAAGLNPVKINAVLMPGVNDHEAADLLTWCLDRGYQLRFIEQMPLDAGHSWNRSSMLTAADIMGLLSERYTLRPDEQPRNGAPAELFRVYPRGSAECLGKVGIIASVTRPFCADCTRTRLTAEGRVRTCLFSRDETDLLTPMRSGASDAEVADIWRAAQWGKQAGHGMDRPDFVQPDRPMSAIGG